MRVRYLKAQVEADLRRKMVFLGGPRQGKAVNDACGVALEER